MASDHLFLFGTHPELSLAELRGWQEAYASSLTITPVPDGALVSGLTSAQAVTLGTTLAGVVKVAEVLHHGPRLRKEDEEELVDLLAELVLRFLGRERKGNFGVSYYGFQPVIPDARARQRIALTVKKQIRTRLDHVRWVRAERLTLSSVVVQSQLIGAAGVELVLLLTDSLLTIGRTVAVQPYEAWGERDFGRPRRNAKQGMLPPKLARMMVHMLGLKPEGTLLDPFAGSGTVLGEAATVGWRSLVACDQQEMAVNDTKKNLAWLTRDESSPATLSTHVASITALKNILRAGTIRAVVTEPFLGSPLTTSVSAIEARRRDTAVLPVYHALLEALAHVLEPGGRAVIVVPAWSLRDGGRHPLPIETLTWPSTLRQLPMSDARASAEALLYARPGQFVTRQLLRLEKVS